MSMDTKTELLNSAERAARTRGIDGFSYADLATEVGIRKASIHHHFPTKAALSAALMARYFKGIEAAFDDISAAHDTGGAQLRAVVQMYRGAINDGKSLCLCVSFSGNRDSLPADVIGQISAFRKMVVGRLEQMFKRGQADGTIADVRSGTHEAAAALSLLEGAQLAARAEEDVQLFDIAVQLLSNRALSM